MGISQEQVKRLVQLVAEVRDDQLDCDGCFAQIAEFAEIQLAGESIPAAMQAIEIHLHNCGCCRDEFETLLKALQGLEG